MTLPIEVIQGALALIGFLVVKSIYGQIERNKVDSDHEDEKVNIDIQKLEDKIQANFEKFVSNDRELYQMVAELRVLIARQEERLDAIRERKKQEDNK